MRSWLPTQSDALQLSTVSEAAAASGGSASLVSSAKESLKLHSSLSSSESDTCPARVDPRNTAMPSSSALKRSVYYRVTMDALSAFLAQACGASLPARSVASSQIGRPVWISPHRCWGFSVGARAATCCVRDRVTMCTEGACTRARVRRSERAVCVCVRACVCVCRARLRVSERVYRVSFVVNPRFRRFYHAVRTLDCLRFTSSMPRAAVASGRQAATPCCTALGTSP